MEHEKKEQDDQESAHFWHFLKQKSRRFHSPQASRRLQPPTARAIRLARHALEKNMESNSTLYEFMMIMLEITVQKTFRVNPEIQQKNKNPHDLSNLKPKSSQSQIGSTLTIGQSKLLTQRRSTR